MIATKAPAGMLRPEDQPTLLARMLAANTLAQMPRCRFKHGDGDRGWPPCTNAATRIVDDPKCNFAGCAGDEMIVCDLHADIWKRVPCVLVDSEERNSFGEPIQKWVDGPPEHIHTKDLPDAKRVRELERIAWGKP